jgi:hypothetical protein
VKIQWFATAIAKDPVTAGIVKGRDDALDHVVRDNEP